MRFTAGWQSSLDAPTRCSATYAASCRSASSSVDSSATTACYDGVCRNAGATTTATGTSTTAATAANAASCLTTIFSTVRWPIPATNISDSTDVSSPIPTGDVFCAGHDAHAPAGACSIPTSAATAAAVPSICYGAATAVSDGRHSHSASQPTAAHATVRAGECNAGLPTICSNAPTRCCCRQHAPRAAKPGCGCDEPRWHDRGSV
mmetsp:Transcript_3707/g.9437  ORF Transcript_3707/g.9437 Transcript_3707/m.9437 type:complete len:206 (+) Transcript_3707:1390-2007(+)